MSTVIRPGTMADVELLVALAERTIRADYAVFLGADAVEAYITSGAVAEYIGESVARCSVILLDARVAGFCVADGPMIELMMIDHELHRRGLGGRLLADCERRQFRDHAELVLESFGPNAKANDFYRKHGWQETGRKFDPESGVDKIEFRKRREATA